MPVASEIYQLPLYFLYLNEAKYPSVLFGSFLKLPIFLFFSSVALYSNMVFTVCKCDDSPI